MPWYSYWDLGDGVARPYLAIWRVKTTPYAALIDSGADGSCLPLGIAEQLGVPFNRSKVRIARGAGGPYEEWVADDDVALDCAVGALILTRPAIGETFPYILLGRRDVFEQYRFAFDQRKQLFQVEPHS